MLDLIIWVKKTMSQTEKIWSVWLSDVALYMYIMGEPELNLSVQHFFFSLFFFPSFIASLAFLINNNFCLKPKF